MPENSDQPIINPILSLTSRPRREGITGRGKNQENIAVDRLDAQRRALSRAFKNMIEEADSKSVSGFVAVVVEMFEEDSLAPTYAPIDLFGPDFGAKLIAPFRNGYLAQVRISAIAELANYIKSTDNIKSMVDISRIRKIELLNDGHVLQDKVPSKMMEKALKITHNQKEYGEFVVWFVPFSTQELRMAAMQSVAARGRVKGLIAATETTMKVGDLGENALIELPFDAVTAFASQNDMVTPIYALALETPKQVYELAASGKVIRIDPVTTIMSAELAVDESHLVEPALIQNQPIVGVIDGGRTAQSYAYAEAWRSPELIHASVADTAHGNSVNSLAVDAHRLNPHLKLPKLLCRTGVVQVLAQPRYRHRNPHPNTLIKYLDNVIAQNPSTKVWNISANEDNECDIFGVSLLGHAITTIARKHNILPVISAGNKLANENLRIAPPADSEAGLVVAGRMHDSNGIVAGLCPRSRIGLGPDEMLKPDVSWFSTMKVLANRDVNGTSFAAPLISQVAAHTWEKLRTPSPDLVKALILNSGDLEKFDQHMGWGSPVDVEHPWECEKGTVCLAWNSTLKPNLEHYWDRIIIPPSMLDGDTLRGKITLTAILDPGILNYAGIGNYCMTRLEVSLQDAGVDEDDQTSNVLGTMQRRLTEYNARKIDHKWSPVRRHSANFRGKALSSNQLRLRARVFTRDLWQLGITANDVPDLNVAFVLKFESPDKSPSTYSSFVRAMGQQVESAVIDQAIEITT